MRSDRARILAEQIALPGGLESQGLQDVVAGDGELRAAGRHEVLGRAIHPVDRPGPPIDRRPGLDPPPAQDVASAHRKLAASLIAECFPVRPAVRMIHPPGDDAEGDVRPLREPLELCQRVPGDAGGAMTGVQVVEERDAQRGGERRGARCFRSRVRSRFRFRSMNARSVRSESRRECRDGS